MNHSAAQVLKQYLIDIGYFEDDLGDDWAIFVGSLPDKPYRAAAVYDTAGLLDGRIQSSGEAIIHHGVQLRVRSDSYNVGWVKIHDAGVALSAAQNATVVLGTSTYTINNITTASSIVSLGPEEGSTRNVGFTSNFILTITLDDES